MRKGFTLIELLIVISIIIILVAFVLINIRGQIAKANDAKRKSDIFTIHNIFEEYYNDHMMYPPDGILDACGGAGLLPYMKQIPCDPVKRDPYGYFADRTSGGYRVCAILEDTTDPAIKAMGCSSQSGCGVGGGFNYCLTQGVTSSEINISGGGAGGGNPTPTPTPGGVPVTPGVGSWACAPPDINGISYCNFYSNPAGSGCPRMYSEPTCNNDCLWEPAVRCRE